MGGVGVGQGVGIEIFITFVLVLCVFSPGTTPLYVGLSIATCHLYAIPLTGSSMNPARSFGPALVANAWANHWWSRGFIDLRFWFQLGTLRDRRVIRKQTR